MASAFLLPLTHLFASLHAWVASFGRPAVQARRAARLPVHPPVPHEAAKPLRVVRVVEPSASRSTAGRMVISGRLADVCAELDRLAALEAQGC